MLIVVVVETSIIGVTNIGLTKYVKKRFGCKHRYWGFSNKNDYQSKNSTEKSNFALAQTIEFKACLYYSMLYV